MRINTNVAALNTYGHLNKANGAQQNSMQKLSSGLRINSAADDAAGLAISEKMRAQVRGLDQASANAQDGISLIQTAEGALQETQDILQRMRELAVQSSNDTNTNEDRAEIQKEVNQLTEEMTRIGNNTEFNTQKLLDGNYDGKTFHIGANEGQNIKVSISDMRAQALGVGRNYSVTKPHTVQDGEVTVRGEIKYGKYGERTDTKEDFNLNAEYYDALDEITITVEGEDDVKVKVEVAGYYTADAELILQVDDGPLAETEEVNLAALNVSSQEDANKAIETFDKAINKVSSERSKLGAFQNRLEHTINNLGTSSENLTAAESRIRDVDYALAA